jgi:hypothetical protein
MPQTYFSSISRKFMDFLEQSSRTVDLNGGVDSGKDYAFS